MADAIAFACLAVIAILLNKRRKRKVKRNRKVWVKEWIKNRPNQGAYNNLMKELKALDTSSYRNFVRMSSSTFEELLVKVAPLIVRQDTRIRKAICPGERLAITLRYLATGTYN